MDLPSASAVSHITDPLESMLCRSMEELPHDIVWLVMSFIDQRECKSLREMLSQEWHERRMCELYDEFEWCYDTEFESDFPVEWSDSDLSCGDVSPDY